MSISTAAISLPAEKQLALSLNHQNTSCVPSAKQHLMLLRQQEHTSPTVSLITLYSNNQVLTDFTFIEFIPRSDWEYLASSYRARYADPVTREEIAKDDGKRWSILDTIEGWLPALNSPIDFMHALLLSMLYYVYPSNPLTSIARSDIVKHIVQVVLYAGGMFNRPRARGSASPLDKIEAWLRNSVWWPATVGRLPFNASYFVSISHCIYH